MENLQLPRILVCTPIQFLGDLTMTSNPILDEIHATREKLLAEHVVICMLMLRQPGSVLLNRGVLSTNRSNEQSNCIEVADQPLPDGGTTPATR